MAGQAWSSPFDFYERLGEFYEEKGYREISHSRIRRYEILLEFLRKKGLSRGNCFGQDMIYDLYLREKLKKRPSFACDQKPYEKVIWDYRKGRKFQKLLILRFLAEEQAVLFDYEHRNPLTNNAAAQESCLTEINKKR